VQQQPPPGDGFAKPPDGDATSGGNNTAGSGSATTTGTIVGNTRDATTLSPVGNMTVSLQGQGMNQSTRSGPDGRFEFKNLPPGHYQVRLQGGNGNPRQAPPMRMVEVKAGAIVQADLEMYPYVPDRGPCCKPYGAPPARRRVV
jgi:hypothetical protein